MGIYSKKELEVMSIYELRTLAREVGVKSPTSKRHGDLVDSILKVQSGEQTVSVSKKGRPPKKVSLNPINTFDFEKNEGMPITFKHVEETRGGNCLCSNVYIDAVNKKYCECRGILRDVDGKKYIYNIANLTRFVNVSNALIEENNLKAGDYIVGIAHEIGLKLGTLDRVDDVNFANVMPCTERSNKQVSVENLEDKDDIYNKIINDDNKNINIALEIEVEDMSILKINNFCAYFCSREFEDIKRSYNAMIDCLDLVKNLSSQNKPFYLHIIDIDYIFYVLNAYLSASGSDVNKSLIDAGQYIKELVGYSKKSTGGNVVIYENKKIKRNDYLDAILNKYL